MKIKNLFLTASLSLAMTFTLSCFGEDGRDGSSCSVEPRENSDGFDVICDGEKVGELASGKDGNGIECIAEHRADSLLIICNDEKIATLYDGKNGEDGADGEPGKTGEQGAIGKECVIADDADNSAYLKITCGNGENKTEKTLAKAMCGAMAYDPTNMNCEKDVLSFSFIDARDDKKYKAVVIGTQIWMAENLNYNDSGSVCYANNESNCDTYGRLYNWATAMGIDTSYNTKTYTDEKKKDICPDGWHLPSIGDLSALMDFIGGGIEASKLKATSGWSDYNEEYSVNIDGTNYKLYRPVSGNGTDDYGFSALPGGYRTGSSFSSISFRGIWWTSSQNPASRGTYYQLYNDPANIRLYDGSKASEYSVRCVKD